MQSVYFPLRPLYRIGKAIALAAYDLLIHPDKVKAIQEKFKELKAKEGK